METAAVGALHQHNVNVFHRFRVAQQFIVTAPNVAGEQESLVLAVFLIINIQHHLRRSQNMAGIVEA